MYNIVVDDVCVHEFVYEENWVNCTYNDDKQMNIDIERYAITLYNTQT